jgi:hypothetical protein
MDMAFNLSSTRIMRLFRRSNDMLDGDTLKRAIGGVVAKILGDRDARLEDPLSDSTSCRTAVLASTSAHADAGLVGYNSYISNVY